MVVRKASKGQAELKVAAVKYADQGLLVVPCHSVVDGRCTCKAGWKCKSPGKHPRQNNWQKTASCDRSTVEAWWNKWPATNVGVATGERSGIVVFDFDGIEGERTLLRFASDDPSIRVTTIHKSGSGGTHLVYQHPGGFVGNLVRAAPGMDVRGDSGLIIFPPSYHGSGGHYTVQNDIPISTLPKLFNAFLRGCHKERQGETKRVEERQGKSKQGAGREVKASEQLPALPKDSIERAIQDSIPIVSGTRNKQVFELARNLLAIDGVTQEIPAIAFRQIVERWHEMAVKESAKRRFCIHGDVEESWTDFRYAWGKVKHPVGTGLNPVFDEVQRLQSRGEYEPPVWNSLQYFRRTENPAMCLLIGVAFELASRAGDEAFSLAVEATAKQLKRLGTGDTITGNWVYRRLKTIEEDGIILCTDKGQAGKKQDRRAAKYRWVWKEQDPPESQFR